METIGDFGWAIQAMKRGEKVARKGWNGKGMYIVLSLDKSSHFLKEPNEQATKVTTNLPYICMSTATGYLQPGWLASQADILSEDWEIA